MKIALVHDFLTQNGGAEQVLETIHEIYPNSPIYVLFFDKTKMGKRFNKATIFTSFLQRIPFALKHYQWYLPFMPSATEHLNLSGFDIVISSSSAFAKGIITSPNTLHICYCHTPTRYLWTDTHEYIEKLNKNFIIKRFLPLLLTNLRIWDRLSAERVNIFIANSKTVQKRIKKYYNSNSVIIYPPVDINKFSLSNEKGKYYLTGGRLVPYKKFDITIDVFNRLKKPLKIFGTGPEFNKLKKLAKQNIQILGKVDDDKLVELYQNSIAFIHPQEEDLGITPIESMACGKPVIGYEKGGLIETVIHNKTGILFKEQTTDSLAHSIRIFENKKFNPIEIREHALKFNKENFKTKFKDFITKSWEEFKKDI